MFVRNHMASPVVTIAPDMPFQDALKLMKEKKFERLPVVDKSGKLIGLVTEEDLLYASPSQATSLSVWELNYLLSKITVGELMTKDVTTTTPDSPIEDAAQLMVEKHVSGLPVVDADHKPVGIITDGDVFEVFVEMFGGGQHGLRLSMEGPRKKGVLAAISTAVFNLGGYIISVGTVEDDEKAGVFRMVMKVKEVNKKQLVDTLEKLGDRVIDARDV